MNTQTRTVFVLVHGSWHGGWCWRKLLPFLRQDNLTVYTPTLTGLGEKRHLATATTNLSTHIQDIVNLLEFEDLHEVILVGHSYGGMVITGVAEQSERVGQLIYLDAIVPEDGESIFSLIRGLETDFKRSVNKEGLVPPWSPEHFGITDPRDIAWVKPRLTPMPLLTHAEKLHAPAMMAKKLPRSFIHCRQFGLGGFGEKIRREGGQVFALDTGHDAMITRPQALAEILLKHVCQSTPFMRSLSGSVR
jgi:pimeloyl-ACP methyl ester carboxylesterase